MLKRAWFGVTSYGECRLPSTATVRDPLFCIPCGNKFGVNMKGASSYFIRRAVAEDAARVGQVARASYAKYVVRMGREPAPMLADYACDIAVHDVEVVELEGVLAAYMVAWAEADAYFIDNIGVEPEHQGKGLGRALIDLAAIKARELGLPALRLYTNVVMTENQSMYAHMGFVETHRLTEKGYHRIYMRLNLV